jgi:hypothetical protein
MTNAMPIFINSLFPLLAGDEMDNQAKQFIEDARKSIALAEKELNYADIAFAQTAQDSESPNLKLAEIAKWHYVNSLKNYGAAIAALEKAGKPGLPAKYKKYVDLKTKKCLEEMTYASERKINLSVVLRTAA